MLGLYSLVIAAVPVLLWYAYSTLFRLRSKQYEDLPRAPPSLIWGHLATIGEFYKKGDSRRHIDYVFHQIGQSVGMPPILILDMRPFFWIMCLVFNHDVAEQISRSTKSLPYSTPKSPTMGAFVPIIGPHSIISAQGENWKSLRRRYNAGFAPSHLMTLLPRIVEKTTSFLHNLDTLAKSKEEFSLEPLCTNLTFDIIGAVVMDVDLNAQLDHSQQSELVKLYRQLLQTYSNDSAAGFLTFHPLVYLRRKRTSRAVDQLLKSIIQDKFAAMTSNTSKDRSVLALSLQGTEELNPLILQQTADQLKSFLFAGHDTTSIVLQWAFYELSRSPSVLATLRAEHDQLFGPNPDPTVVSQILCTKGDEIIPKLTYTSAVIKEILRLYPPASTARRVAPGGGFFVKLPDGRDVCLDGMVLYNMHFVVQRDPEIYGPTAEIFSPERWLGDVDTSAAAADPDTDTSGTPGDHEGIRTVPPSAWRAFERGPRNCIGQELANIEARVILALAVRRYDFEKVGAGRLERDGDGKTVVHEVTGQYEVETPLFNTRQVTSKPFDGMMMKVRLRRS